MLVLNTPMVVVVLVSHSSTPAAQLLLYPGLIPWRDNNNNINQLSIPNLLPHLGWIAASAQTGRIGPMGPPRKIGNILAFF